MLTSRTPYGYRYVFAPDVQFAELDFSRKVLVPIMIFHDHEQYDLLDTTRARHLDMRKARKAASCFRIARGTARPLRR